MSLIVCVYVPTGIIISGDSRTTVTTDSSPVFSIDDGEEQTPIQERVILSDATNKIFLVMKRFGVGTFGDALIHQLPIEHYVCRFEREYASDLEQATTEQFTAALLAYFRQFDPIPDMGFIIAGYDETLPAVFSISVLDNTYERHNVEGATDLVQYGVTRGGDMDIINRLLSQSECNPVFDWMNLQDAVDFSRHLIQVTKDQLRFEPRFATVGGPIDTLLIQPDTSRFLARKLLTC